MFCDSFYVVFLIVLGGVFGCLAKKEGDKHSYSLMVGIATAFIAVPFTASFVKLDYSLLQWSKLVSPEDTQGSLSFQKFIEHSLMLVSISGLSSYIGFALLDSLADKVMKKDIETLEGKQKKIEETNNEIKNNNELLQEKNAKMELELERLKARDLYNRIIFFENQGDKEKVKVLCGEVIELIGKYDNPSLDYEFMITRACIHKRLGQIDEAISILDKLIAFKVTPLALFNKACYLYIKRKNTEGCEDIKRMIFDGFDLKIDGADKEVQARILKKVVDKKDVDIAGLFSDDELSEIKARYFKP